MLTQQLDSHYNCVINDAAFRLALKNKCPLTFISTACAYDTRMQTDSKKDQKRLLQEDQAFENGICPESIYGMSKALGEFAAKRLWDEYHIPVSIVRFFNAYGERESGDVISHHVIPALIKKMLDGMNPLEVWGSGKQQRSFIYVKDAVDGILLIAEKIKDGTPVNMGDKNRVTIKHLAELIWKSIRPGTEPNLKFDISKPQGVFGRAPDVSRAETLGWAQKVTLEEGIEKTVHWYRKEIRRGKLK